jgi:hypothetical protein
MTDTEELKHFLFAIAELAGEEGDAAEQAVQARYGESYRSLWNHATDKRYLKPLAEPGRLALTTMGRFAAGTLG